MTIKVGSYFRCITNPSIHGIVCDVPTDYVKNAWVSLPSSRGPLKCYLHINDMVELSEEEYILHLLTDGEYYGEGIVKVFTDDGSPTICPTQCGEWTL